MGVGASAIGTGSYAAAASPPGGFDPVLPQRPTYPSPVAGGPLATAAMASNAAAPAPETSRPMSTAANIVLWMAALGPVASVMMPWFYNLHTGNIKKTAKLFATPGFVTAAFNAIVWLLYNSAVIKQDKTLDLAVASAVIASVAANYVMAVLAQRGEKTKGYVLGGFVLACFGGVFAMARWDEVPSETIVLIFGYLAITLLFLCLVIQFADIGDCGRQRDRSSS